MIVPKLRVLEVPTCVVTCAVDACLARDTMCDYKPGII